MVITFENIKIISTRLANSSAEDMLLLDNGYLNITYFYGIFGILVMHFIFARIFTDVIDNKREALFIILSIYMLYGFTETGFYKLNINPYILWFAYLLYNNNKRKVAVLNEKNERENELHI